VLPTFWCSSLLLAFSPRCTSTTDGLTRRRLFSLFTVNVQAILGVCVVWRVCVCVLRAWVCVHGVLRRGAAGKRGSALEFCNRLLFSVIRSSRRVYSLQFVYFNRKLIFLCGLSWFQLPLVLCGLLNRILAAPSVLIYISSVFSNFFLVSGFLATHNQGHSRTHTPRHTHPQRYTRTVESNLSSNNSIASGGLGTFCINCAWTWTACCCLGWIRFSSGWVGSSALMSTAKNRTELTDWRQRTDFGAARSSSYESTAAAAATAAQAEADVAVAVAATALQWANTCNNFKVLETSRHCILYGE